MHFNNAARSRANGYHRFLALFLLGFLAITARVNQAQAEGFSLYDYGARGSSLGGAMMARKPDPSAVAHNPALITQLPGSTIMAGFTAIGISGDILWSEGGRSGRTSVHHSIYTIPHAYFTRQLSQDWFLGIGEFSRFGLGNEYPSDWPGRFNVYEVYLLSASLNPVIAYKATDKLSLAAGVELLYASLSMKNRISLVPGVAEVDARIEKADDLGIGFNLAAHYRFNDQWSIGLHYRSPVRIEAKGKMYFSYLGPDISQITDSYAARFKDGIVKGTVTLPESIALGVAYNLSEKTSLELGLTWTRWSRYQSLNFELPGNLPPSINPKHWQDTWRVTFGVERVLNDWLDLRVGFNWTESPMTTNNADYTVPTNDRLTYTLGLGFHNDSFSLDVAYILVDCRSRSFNSSPLPNGNGTLKSKSQSYMAHEGALSLTYHF
ncbi:MAG: outer membrane protein transport protein [Deltaproteobacteria bacterium]|jgi:long-chain fatty acid transport protein|nr:outer membrane protein transport protein [Deltaproteobacteria bacterium]